MAEILGTVSAIVGLLQVSGQVLVAGYGFLSRVRQAPIEVRNLLNEVAAVNTLLGRLQDFASDRAEAEGTLRALNEQGILGQCEDAIGKVDKVVKSCTIVEGEYMKNLTKRVKFPFKEDDVKKTMSQLERLRKQLTDALTLDMATAIKRIEETDRQIQKGVDELVVAQDIDELSEWAFPVDVDPHKNYEHAIRSRQEGTGTWLLQTDLYQRFIESRGICWIHGLPGCGKTVLSTTVIEKLLVEIRSAETGVIYFYCDYRDTSKQSLSTFLMTSVRQLVQQKPDAMRHLRELFHTKRNDLSRKPTQQDYIDLLRVISKGFSRVYLVIDALDEANDAEGFVDFFKDITNESSETPISVLITSRTNVVLEHTLLPFVASNISLTGLIQQDIDAYVSISLLERLDTRQLKLRDSNLAPLIKNKIIERSGGLFLQAKLHLEYISGMKNDRSVKKALENLPNALESAYERILSNVMSDPDRACEARSVLLWLSQGLAPVTLDMLAEAVAIQPDDTYLDDEAIATDPEDVIESLSSLVTVDRRQSPVVVSLAHYSIDEYLRSQSILQSPVAMFYIAPIEAHRYLADICIQYLSFDNFAEPVLFRFHNNKQRANLPRRRFAGSKREYGNPQRRFRVSKIESPALELRLETYALLQYAADFWAPHLRQSYTDDQVELWRDRVEPKLQWFLQPQKSTAHHYESWIETHYSQCNIPHDCEYWQPPLHHAINLGLTHATSYLLPIYTQAHDINAQFPGGWNPLIAATSIRSPQIAKLILDAGAAVDAPAEYEFHNGFTALQLAAERGNVPLVQLLLEHKASVHATTRTGTTAFYRAARGGSLEVLEILYEAGSDIDMKSWDSYTPLMEAVRNRDTPMTQWLLDRGANPLTRTRSGFTALGFAQSKGDSSTEIVLVRWMRLNRGKNGGRDSDEHAVQGDIQGEDYAEWREYYNRPVGEAQ